MKQSYKKMQQKRRKKKSIATSKKQFSKRAFIKATEDIKAQYHVHQNKSQQQLDIQDEIDKTIKFICGSVRDESVYSEQRAEIIKALAELVSARTLIEQTKFSLNQPILKDFLKAIEDIKSQYDVQQHIEVAENTKSILKETGLKLKEVQILPDTLLYVSLYHLALAVDNIGKHELSKDICHALLNELEKQELISKRAFIKATEDIKSQYHV